MKPLQIMIVAGEPSGDQLAAELVAALRAASDPAPVFFGAGGPRLAAAGVDLSFDLTQHALIGLPSVGEYFKFRGFLRQLVEQARQRQPEVFIGVDYFGFNGRLARSLRQSLSASAGPRMVQFVSPQVWASRPGRARLLESNHDLLLSLLPFEKSWYAAHAPRLRVEFIGHPLVDRHAADRSPRREPAVRAPESVPTILLLPGSRVSEVKRHTPLLVGAAHRLARGGDRRFRLIAPNADLAELARPFLRDSPAIELQVGGLDEALASARLALASTGTVTLECAWFGVPFVALYRTSWLTYEIGRRLVTVKHLAMPNLLAGETVAPECIQGDATPERIAAAAEDILSQPGRHAAIRTRLAEVVASLGPPGAVQRGATAILGLLRAAHRGSW